LNGFVKNSTAPCLYGLDCLRYITVTGNKDDWQIGPRNRNPLLHLETVESMKGEVEDY